MARPPDVEPVVLHGRLVALAGRDRCHVIDTSLDKGEVVLVAAMCLYLRLTRGTHARGPRTFAEAEAWAQRFLQQLSTPP